MYDKGQRSPDQNKHAAAFRTKILHVYGFDPVSVVFSRGEIPQHAGSSPGSSTRRILDSKMLICGNGHTIIAFWGNHLSNTTCLTHDFFKGGG